MGLDAEINDNFIKSIKRLFTNWPFMLLTLTYGEQSRRTSLWGEVKIENEAERMQVRRRTSDIAATGARRWAAGHVREQGLRKTPTSTASVGQRRLPVCERIAA